MASRTEAEPERDTSGWNGRFSEGERKVRWKYAGGAGRVAKCSSMPEDDKTRGGSERSKTRWIPEAKSGRMARSDDSGLMVCRGFFSERSGIVRQTFALRLVGLRLTAYDLDWNSFPSTE